MYGIINPPLACLLSYTSDPLFATKINSSLSRLCTLAPGIDRDSVSGFVLFVLHITGIFKVTGQSRISLFADDIEMVYHFETGTFNSTFALINEDLKFLVTGVPSGLKSVLQTGVHRRHKFRTPGFPPSK